MPAAWSSRLLEEPKGRRAEWESGTGSLAADWNQGVAMAAGAGDHLMLSRLGLGEENAEKAGSSTLLLHESVVRVHPAKFVQHALPLSGLSVHIPCRR